MKAGRPRVCTLHIFTELLLMQVVFHHPLPYQFFYFVVSISQRTRSVSLDFYFLITILI